MLEVIQIANQKQDVSLIAEPRITLQILEVVNLKKDIHVWNWISFFNWNIII